MCFRGFNGPAGSKGEIHSIIPRLTIHGDYKMKGKILVLPIQGHGKCNFTIGKFIIPTTITTKKNNPKNYLQITQKPPSSLPQNW